MSPMNPSDFLTILEQHLRPRGIPFSRAALQCFVDSTWPWIADDPDVEAWGTRFLESADVMAPETVTP